jgi:hypothetical protein
MRHRGDVIRRIERWLVGLVMAILAFVIEKAVLRSIRRGDAKPRPVETTPITATGRDVSAD